MDHFGDDINLEFLVRNLYTIESVINHELKLSVEWLRSNKSSLNKTKTKLIYLDLLGRVYHMNQTLDN